jgi:hypothetical protein
MDDGGVGEGEDSHNRRWLAGTTEPWRRLRIRLFVRPVVQQQVGVTADSASR